jgi:exodeoxyribonuclease III
VRVATWNVNSVRQRVERLLPWLDQRRPDVVCLQETKLADSAFATLLGAALKERGYEFAAHGEAQWNGVALLSRVGLSDVVAGLDGGPGFPHPEARAVAATCGGIRIHSVYVPNGRAPGSEHYRYKLAWLSALRAVIATGPPDAMVCGDMNIAPTDADVFDPDAYVGQTHVTEPERTALASLIDLGLHDVVRDRWPSERVFTYWDYRAGMFPNDLGMRIDLVLATGSVASRVAAAWVDRKARKGSRPSDHAPVIVDLDTAPDGDIGPVVPPPSAKPVKRGSVKLPQALGVVAGGSQASPRRRLPSGTAHAPAQRYVDMTVYVMNAGRGQGGHGPWATGQLRSDAAVLRARGGRARPLPDAGGSPGRRPCHAGTPGGADGPVPAGREGAEDAVRVHRHQP